MDNTIISEYISRFNKHLSLLENASGTSVWQIDLSKDALEKNKQLFADKMIKQSSENSDEIFHTAAMIFYGFRLGAVHLKGKNECFTRQDGYMDSAIWHFNLDEFLDVTSYYSENSSTEEQIEASVDNIINWSVNPEGNVDIADEALRRMIYPIVANLNKTAIPGKTHQCTIYLPPMSTKIDISDFSSLFEKLKTTKTKIEINNYGALLSLKQGERKYIFINHDEFTVISAYEQIRGHNTCLGALAFSDENTYELHDFKPISFTIERNNYASKPKPAKDVILDWEYIPCKYPQIDGLNSFLGNHDSTFGNETYKVYESDNISTEVEEIKALFHNGEALQVIGVCSRLLSEKNLYNISLGDVVYIARLLEKDKHFKSVMISTKKKSRLGSLPKYARNVDMSKIESIPANYATISWILKDKNKKTVPYFYLDIKSHSDIQIIESIINHYSHCTTAEIAEDILYLNNNNDIPSAYFTAKVFIYLSEINSIQIESRNEYISFAESVDDKEFVEIDKSTIQFYKEPQKNPKQTSYVQPKTKNQLFIESMFKQSSYTNVKNSSKKKNKGSSNELTIHNMGFSVRTFNCLKRAGITKAQEITRMNMNDLLKVRNLGKKGATEIIERVHALGLKFDYE